MNRRRLSPNDPPVILAQPLAQVERSGQCDACPTSHPLTPRPIVAHAPYVLPSNHCQIALDREHTLIHHEGLPAPVVLNRSALAIAHAFTAPRLLAANPAPASSDWGQAHIQKAVQRMASLGVLLPANSLGTETRQPATALIAWLHLTDRCNLRCAYCFLPHNPEDMTSETGEQVVGALFRSAAAHDYRQVKLKYAGGEPLLRFPLIIRLHQQAQALAEKTSITLDEVILSNGVLLTPPILAAIRSRGIRLMISLDGLGQHDDHQRAFTNGSSSSARAMRAIEQAQSLGVTPEISITVTQRSAHGLPDLLAWVLERKLPFSLNLYRENDLSVQQKDLTLEDETIIAGMLAAYRVIEQNLPEQNLLAALADRVSLASAHQRTCSVGENYVVFDARGRAAKCQMQIGQPVTSVSPENALELVRADTNRVLNIPVNEKETCRDCRWKHWCAGGCPLETQRASGRFDTKSPHCAIYQALIPEALRLEGLRLLKYAHALES